MSLHTGLDQIREPEMPFFSIGGIVGRSLWIVLWNFFSFIAMAIVLAIPLIACAVLVDFAAGDLGFSLDIARSTVRFQPRDNFDLVLASLLGLLAVFTVLAPAAAYAERAYQSMLGRSASFAHCTIKSFAALPKLIVLGILLLAAYGIIGWILVHAFIAVAAPTYGFFWVFVAVLLSLTVYMFLFAILWLAIPVLMIEWAGPFKALWRSWSLTRGRRWQIVAVGVLLLLPYALIQVLLMRMAPGDPGTDLARLIAFAIDLGHAILGDGGGGFDLSQLPALGIALARVLLAVLFYFLAAVSAAIGYFHLVGEKEGILALDRMFP